MPYKDPAKKAEWEKNRCSNPEYKAKKNRDDFIRTIKRACKSEGKLVFKKATWDKHDPKFFDDLDQAEWDYAQKYLTSLLNDGNQITTKTKKIESLTEFKKQDVMKWLDGRTDIVKSTKQDLISAFNRSEFESSEQFNNEFIDKLANQSIKTIQVLSKFCNLEAVEHLTSIETKSYLKFKMQKDNRDNSIKDEEKTYTERLKLDWEDYIVYSDFLISVYNAHKNKKFIMGGHPYLKEKNMLDLVLLMRLYTKVCVCRNDYKEVMTEKSDTENYIDIENKKFVMQKYKTSEAYGMLYYNIDDETLELIKERISDGRKYLFCQTNDKTKPKGNEMSYYASNLLTKYLGSPKLFECSFSVMDIRHAKATEIHSTVDGKPRYYHYDIKKMCWEMQHDFETSKYRYVRLPAEERTGSMYEILTLEPYDKEEADYEAKGKF